MTSKRTKVKPAAKRSAARRPVRREPQTLRLRAVTPSLTVNDLERSIRFYTHGLGFIVEQRWEQNGRLSGVMLKAGRCNLALAQDDFAKGRDRVKGVGHSVWLATVQSLDVLAARLKANGVALAQELATMPWGRTFAVVDPDGFKLTVAKE